MEAKTWIMEAYNGNGKYPSMVMVGVGENGKPFKTEDLAKAKLWSSADISAEEMKALIKKWSRLFPAPELCYTLRAFEVQGMTCGNPIMIDEEDEELA